MKGNASTQDSARAIHVSVVAPAVLVVLAVTAFIVAAPETATGFFTGSFNFLTGSLGWVFTLVCIVCCVLLGWFIFGPYANKRLGDKAPERSTFSWAAMMFASACSSSIVYWSFVEFFYYLQEPPFGAEPFSLEALRWGTAYGPFHWGIAMFSMYAVCAILIAVILHVRKTDASRISALCVPVLGEKVANGPVGKIIDVVFLVSLCLSAAGTTLGLSTPLISALAGEVLGIEDSLLVKAAIIIVLTVLFTLTTFTGLQKGMKLIANVRVGLIFGILAFILVVGGTPFILSNTIETLGTQLQYFPQMLTYTDAVGGSGWPQEWTQYYWAFTLSALLGNGLYYARLSEGRTVRQVALIVTLSCAVGCMVFFWVMGNFSASVYLGDPEQFKVLMAQNPYDAIIYAVGKLPLAPVVLVALLIYSFVAVWSFIGGTAFTLSMASHRNLKGDEEPSKGVRIFWCVLIGMLAVALLFLGGLQIVKSSAVLSGGLSVIIAIPVFLSGFKEMKRLWGGDTPAEPAKNDGSLPHATLSRE